jgi:hypothetical protein
MLRYLLVLVLVLSLVEPLLAGEDIAIVKDIEGEVTVRRIDQILSIKQKDYLQEGDILITGNAGRIAVIFHDGSVLSLGEKSMLRIISYKFKPIEEIFNFDLELEKGSAIFESGKIGALAPEKFSFNVPEGTIGIRGTKFLVEVN